MKKTLSLILLSLLFVSLASASTIFIPQTKKYYPNATIEQTIYVNNISLANYVPYIDATTGVDLGSYNLNAENIYSNNVLQGLNLYALNGLFISRAGIPQIEFTNTAGTDGTGIAIIGKVNRADALGVYYKTGEINLNRKGSWTGTDARNYNSYMTFSTLIDKALTENMRITNDGNIGIGTTDPQWKLDVSGITRTDDFISENWIESTPDDYSSNGWIGMTYDITTTDIATYFGMQSYAGDNIFDLYGQYNEFSLGTDGSDNDNFKIGVGYALDGAFDRNDFVMNSSGDIYINNNLQVNGTFTYTNFYAEGYYYNSTGGGTPYTIDIVSSNTNYNLTNWFAGETNGFTFENNGVTANNAGIYQLSGSITFTGANGEEYAFTMTKDGTPISKCGMGLTASLSTRENVALTCLVELNAGEHLNLQVMDKNSPAQDINIYKVNLNIIKISD